MPGRIQKHILVLFLNNLNNYSSSPLSNGNDCITSLFFLLTQCSKSTIILPPKIQIQNKINLYVYISIQLFQTLVTFTFSACILGLQPSSTVCAVKPYILGKDILVMLLSAILNRLCIEDDALKCCLQCFKLSQCFETQLDSSSSGSIALFVDISYLNLFSHAICFQDIDSYNLHCSRL